MSLLRSLFRDRRREAELGETIRKLRYGLKVEQCHVAGLSAQLNDMITSHPKSPEMVVIGRRGKDGSVVTAGRAKYERAFEVKARELGVLGIAFPQ